MEKKGFQEPEIGEEIRQKMRAYEIKVWPKGQERIWRILEATDRHTLHQLSQIIKREFGLSGEHLYCFYLSERPYDSKMAYNGPQSETQRSALKTHLAQVELKRGKRFVYLYDFIRERIFYLQVERVFSTDRSPPEPQVIKKAGSTPVIEEPQTAVLPHELEELKQDIADAAEAASEGKRRSPQTLRQEFELAMNLARIVQGRWDLVKSLERETKADVSGWLIALPEHLADEGMAEEALTLIDTFMELEPPSFLNEKPFVLLKAGRQEEAVRRAEENALEFAEDPWILAKSAELLWRAGRQERAEELFRRALDLSANARYLRETVLERLMALLEEMGKTEAARQLAMAEEKRRTGTRKA